MIQKVFQYFFLKGVLPWQGLKDVKKNFGKKLQITT